jgi:4'-phosphopantetheinyl transferase
MADADTVRVWSIDLVPRPALLAHLAALLDDDERRRAAMLLVAADRHRFVLRHGAARIIVGRYLDAPPERIRWRHGPFGKPELARPWAGVQVNLSHSGDLALLALVDGRAVGVDVQVPRPAPGAVRMAARYFPAAESRFVAAGGPGEQADRFARLWVRKEACVKAAGVRLVQGLPVRVNACADSAVVTCASNRYLVRDLAVPPGHRAAVAVAGTREFDVVRYDWQP